MKFPSLFKQKIDEPESRRYYRKYLADTDVRTLNEKLVQVILEHSPSKVLEFGAGRGKNLKLLHEKNPGITAIGIDISKENMKNKVFNNMILGSEDDLESLGKFDLIFTCSCLDHIQYINVIISKFKEMTDHIVIAETNSYDTNYYYKHNYEGYGFKKLAYSYCSNGIQGDGATYEIWTWSKQAQNPF